MECNIGQDAILFNSFGNALLYSYIYKGWLVKISANISFFFYKEIYMKYLILYYKSWIFQTVVLAIILKRKMDFEFNVYYPVTGDIISSE